MLRDVRVCFCGTTRIRTGDTRIFSPMLYQLSYGTKVLNKMLELWYHQDSNRGHTDFQSDALPTELWHLEWSTFDLASAKVRFFFAPAKLLSPFFISQVLKGGFLLLFSNDLQEQEMFHTQPSPLKYAHQSPNVRHQIMISFT